MKSLLFLARRAPLHCERQVRAARRLHAFAASKKIFCLALGWAVLAASSAVLAQEDPIRGQNRRSEPVDVRGRVYLPDGTLLQRSIRMQLTSDDVTRSPETVFTDTNGHFILEGLIPDHHYILSIEAEPKNWGTTIFRFMVSGDQTSEFNVQLEPPEAAARAPVVSASALKQKVPAAARKQYEAGIKSILAGNPEEGLRQLERAIDLFPDYVEAHNEVAVRLMKSGNLLHAQEHLRLALKVDPAAVRPLLNLGLCLQRQGRSADALPYLERAAQLQPGDATVLLVLGNNLMLVGDDARAEAQLLRAYEIGGTSVTRAQLALAEIYSKRKEFAKAAAALEIYLRNVPGDPSAAELQAALARFRAAAQQQH